MPSPGRFPAPSEDDIQEATNETSTARTKRPKYSHETLLDELTNIDFDQRNLHRVVLNYLNTNMCKDTYVNFLRESGFIGPSLSDTISHRRRVKDAIISGNSTEARKLMDEIDPSILQKNVRIMFNLLANEVIDAIKSGNVALAIEYARNKLAPCVKEENALLEKLEAIMGLITFSDFNDPDVSQAVNNIQQLEHTAQMADVAILDYFGQESYVTLESLVKEAMWLQQQLSSEDDWGRLYYYDITRAGITINEEETNEE
ncbi:CTLH/CRA C-terminal to LisH motif domain family protein [Babesia bovis T2Bo]|uniref:CTLH domain-containing protein n=1 Tax=Babesia bovis TaxID=5865 RepID=A7AWU4_BABBO|nr:CTLH/CRA C-terminal to LisH motif domain family protein [Babesia bovis T2Bo]EDO05522.1 CTLH/CRA C-terminal to LisH motif domain family protein [Babesia bovis T2Bo]BAN65762.1 conserved hypothetical protein [Babesia bovis]|eukprot:XP_001609090.1 hypothetical protein [Babesia bovis T2Bo]